MKSPKVLAIALDAAEPSLIEQWMNEGLLKNMARLRSKGAYGRLASSADWLVGSTWPTFYTSTLPDKHGFYHYMQWDCRNMEYKRPGPDWIDAKPFWRNLGDNLKVIAVDIPLAFPPTPINGIEISGWAAHDRIYPVSSYPAEKIEWVVKKIGKPLISDEVGGLQRLGELIRLKNELVSANEKEAGLISTLMDNEEWNLFLCCFASTHRAGHKFWTKDYDQRNASEREFPNVKESYTRGDAEEFRSALKEVYISCDESIGKILSRVPEDVTVLIFSLHGMGVNTNLADKILPLMLNRILSGTKQQSKPKQTTVNKLRNMIPLDIRSKIRTVLPAKLQDKMTAYWRMGKVDWTATRAFSLVADLQGYIRINLKGRERNGIVEMSEYDELCDKIISGIESFADSNTNESIVNSIIKTKDLFNHNDAFNKLPDILVKWKFKPAASYTKIISPLYGEVEWPMPGFNPDGRSGNHRPDGFILVSGEGISFSDLPKRHIIDIAPTILELLGVPVPSGFDGKAIKEILSPVQEYKA